jgi:methionyl-tRNA formyltransferase
MIKKEDGLLDFNQSADELSNRVRAYNPWPGTYFLWNHVMVKVYRAHAVHNGECNPQKNYVINGFPAVGTSSGWLVLDDVQPAGKKVMPGDVFLRGYHHWNE